MHGPSLGRAVALSLAAIRVAVIAAIFIAERAETPVELHEEAFDALLAGAALWALAIGALVLAGRRERVRPYEALVDLALLGALTFVSGGAFSEVRQAFFVAPIVAAALGGPRLTILWALAAAATYSAAALASDVGDLPGAGETILVHDIFIGVVAVASVLASILLQRWTGETLAQAERSRALARELLEVRDAERRRLAAELHDHPVQLLGAARVELGAAREGDRAAIDRIAVRVEEAEAALRSTAIELHPYALEQLGLCGAVRQIAEAECERAGIELRLDCDALSPTGLDRQIFLIARELISNAARHSGGSVVEVSVRRRDDLLSLTVRDDGAGLNEERRAAALQSGHLGLVSVAERSAVIGGELSVGSASGVGTRVELEVRLEDPGEGREMRSKPRHRSTDPGAVDASPSRP